MGKPRTPGARTKLKATNPLIIELINLLDQSGRLIDDVRLEAGISATSIRNIRSGITGMQLTSFVALANTLGYDVILRKKSDE